MNDRGHSRMRLERQLVVRAALDLLNKVGIEGLTTRRLAEELGVQGPALYWHFKNKQELIDEMAMALLAEAHGDVEPREDWAEWMAEGARRMRQTLLSYRDGALVLAGFRPSQPAGRLDRSLIFAPLREAGFDPDDAKMAMITVGLFTFGWAMDEQAASGRAPPSDSRFDPDRGFEFGLGTIILGLKARLAAQAAARAEPAKLRPAEPAAAADWSPA
jgi:TetR/AcrR family tetracycline transcriptional repressor